MNPHCAFCGRHQDDCPRGLMGRDPYICIYCNREFTRAWGDVFDLDSTPVDLIAWKQQREGGG